jgi:hypothetical protein
MWDREILQINTGLTIFVKQCITDFNDTVSNASGVVFYVGLYQNFYVKFISTVLCNAKDPTWILCESDIMCKIYLYKMI